jgi:hypothetical protein
VGQFEKIGQDSQQSLGERKHHLPLRRHSHPCGFVQARDQRCDNLEITCGRTVRGIVVDAKWKTTGILATGINPAKLWTPIPLFQSLWGGGSPSTTKIAMPVAKCHSIWQWKNQNPGLSASHCTTAQALSGMLRVSFWMGSFSLRGCPL